jgi:hypothetical protein
MLNEGFVGEGRAEMGSIPGQSLPWKGRLLQTLRVGWSRDGLPQKDNPNIERKVKDVRNTD